jgi:hypothetical protein
MRAGFRSGITSSGAAGLLLAIALAFAGGCETEHTTPEWGRNPPPPPQRMPRAVEMSTGVQLLSSELSEEEAEKLKQGSTETEAESESETETETEDAAAE